MVPYGPWFLEARNISQGPHAKVVVDTLRQIEVYNRLPRQFTRRRGGHIFSALVIIIVCLQRVRCRRGPRGLYIPFALLLFCPKISEYLLFILLLVHVPFYVEGSG